ncbi:hypothetical protein [Streptomyces sp. NPDC002564]|uniref:hypothetical protein n=1 Tax=Streptomyces sp. NPDC002564 TaxID=3364649 RepID=UPI0036A550E7
MNRTRRTATRLAHGSTTLTRRLAARTAAWVARGRRPDLTGWRALLGCWARIALLAFGAYLLWRLLRALPALMWLLTTGWLAASWRAGREVAEQSSAEAPAAPPAAPSGEALRELLLTLMGSDSAVHLSTVLDHLQQRPDTAALTASWQVSDLRAQLEAAGIPVHLKVKAGGRGPTRGVRRVDLAPSPGATKETSTATSTAA